jgi:acetyltransferase-like isoleucine patch superfamily enzyme
VYELNGFFSQDELNNLGLKAIGHNVLISRKCSIYGANNITIGNNARIDDFCILSGKIEIQNNIHIGAYSAIFAGKQGVTLESFSGCSSRVSIYAVNDDYSGEYMIGPAVPIEFRHVTEGKIQIGKHTIIGASSVILPGLTLGEGTAIGAMSLVIQDTLPWSINAGIPAKKIRDRSRKLLEFEKQLLEGSGINA